MEWFEQAIRSLEQARDESLTDKAPVAFYGSSSIRLWATLADDFPGAEVVNLGFGGSTLEACAKVFKRVVVPWRPRSLVVYAGDNDLGDGQGPEQVRASLHDLLRQVDDDLGPIPVAFLSIKPSPARQYLDAQIRTVNTFAREDLDARPAGHFIDLYPRMLGDNGTPRPELYDTDGLHLSPLGYRLWAETLSLEIPQLL